MAGALGEICAKHSGGLPADVGRDLFSPRENQTQSTRAIALETMRIELRKWTFHGKPIQEAERGESHRRGDHRQGTKDRRRG